MFSATIHADTFEAEEQPPHRQANWAIVKKGAEPKVLYNFFYPICDLTGLCAGIGRVNIRRRRSI